jgi:DNA integrity scanning protein DisA with diadenylate cyclase activity
MLIPKILCYFGIFQWQDFYSLMIVILCVYKFLNFLSSHRTVNLLSYTYILYLNMLFAYFINCQTIFNFLMHSTPVILIILILMHQKNLQKNWLGVGVAKIEKNNLLWLDELAKILIWAKHHNYFPLILIEQFDEIESILENQIEVNANYNTQLLKSLIDCNQAPTNQIIVLNNNNIKLVNASFLPNQLFYNDQIMSSTHVTAMTSTIIVFCTADNLKINLFANGNTHLIESHNLGSTLRQFILNQKLKLKESLDDKHQFYSQRAQTTTSVKI